MCCEGQNLNSLLRPDLELAFRFHVQATNLRMYDAPDTDVPDITGKVDQKLVHHIERVLEIAEVGKSFGDDFEEQAFKNRPTDPPTLERLQF